MDRGPIVGQFFFYNDKMNIFQRYKKFKTHEMLGLQGCRIVEDFSRESTAIHKDKWKEGKQGKYYFYNIIFI